MTDSKGVESIKRELKKTIVDYVETEYFGKTASLRKRCDDELRFSNTLFQEPYFESTPAYEIANNGLALSDIPQDAKEFLISMATAGRGVFMSPYSHQIDALEAFWHEKDVLVSTGTGSGKTECFMWPLVSKMAVEAKVSEDSWRTRAVRALVLYPMNALVSDQLGRLRKILGGNAESFGEVCQKEAVGLSLACIREGLLILAISRSRREILNTPRPSKETLLTSVRLIKPSLLIMEDIQQSTIFRTLFRR